MLSKEVRGEDHFFFNRAALRLFLFSRNLCGTDRVQELNLQNFGTKFHPKVLNPKEFFTYKLHSRTKCNSD